jgi:flagella basal body P-ring formation protein FlgA
MSSKERFRRVILTTTAFFATICAALFFVHPAHAADFIITLNELSAVDGPYIELGEIAAIDAPDDAYAPLAALRIGIAPTFANPITYRKTDLAARLALEGYTATQFEILGKDQVKIERAGVKITSAELEQVLANELAASFGESVTPVWKVKLPEITVNRGNIEIIVKYPSYRFGALPQTIIVNVDGRLARQFPLSGYASFKTPVVITTQGIPRGACVSADCVEIVERTLPPGAAVIAAIDGCIGLEAKRNIGAGEQLTYDSLIKPYDAKRGDDLTVTILRGGIIIEALATAREDAYIGEQMLVELVDTGKTLRVTLTSSNNAVAVLPSNEVQG